MVMVSVSLVGLGHLCMYEGSNGVWTWSYLSLTRTLCGIDNWPIVGLGTL
jgi:hypothetical protein